jgi:hypothetical protein
VRAKNGRGTWLRATFLHLGRTAVDEELDAGDVTAVVGGEEDNSLCDLVGGTEPSHGNDVAEVGHALPADVAAAEEFLKGGGVDRSGAYNVDADAACLQICGPCAGKGPDRGLGCRVDAVGGETFAANDGAIENDGGAVGKQRKRLFDGKQEAFYVAGEDGVEVIFIDGFEGKVCEDARVGEDNIEPALFLFNLSKEAVQVLQIRHVTLNGAYVRTDLFDGLVEFGLIAAGDEDVGSFADEVFRRGETDAAVAAGNQCNFSVKFLHIFCGTPWDGMSYRWRLCLCRFIPYGGCQVKSGLEFVEQGLHFAGGVGIFRALGGAEAFFEAGDGFIGAA